MFLTGEDLHEMVEVFCDNMDSSVTLPDIGTWVAVRVTAVFNPGHFWVQFPYGTEPIEKSIMAGKPQTTSFLCDVLSTFESVDILFQSTEVHSVK